MTALHTETRGGRFRWLLTVEVDDTCAQHTVRTELAGGLSVERITPGDGADAAMIFVTDASGGEITLSGRQCAELRAALGELPITT